MAPQSILLSHRARRTLSRLDMQNLGRRDIGILARRVQKATSAIGGSQTFPRRHHWRRFPSRIPECRSRAASGLPAPSSMPISADLDIASELEIRANYRGEYLSDVP